MDELAGPETESLLVRVTRGRRANPRLDERRRGAREMSPDEWEFMVGTWNVFENSHGWRLTLDVDRLPSRMEVIQRREYAKALLHALNHGMPDQP